MNSVATALVIILLVAGMLAMGTATSGAELRQRLRSPGALLTTLAINLLVIPGLAIGLIAALTDPTAASMALALVAASPGGGTGALLAFHARGDVAHAVTLQVALAATSLVAMPVWIAIYAASTPTQSLPLLSLVASLLGFQLAPLLFGLWLRSAHPTLAAPVHTHARRVADLSLAVLIAVLLVASGSKIGTIGGLTFVGIAALVAVTVAAGVLTAGNPAVRRASMMTTLVRNLSLALMAARFVPHAATTALIILAYGLVMYVTALAIVALSRARQ